MEMKKYSHYDSQVVWEVIVDELNDIKVNTKITKKGKIIFTNLGKKYYTELSKFSILLNISFSL